tara:strand:+ start:940 stop:1338 length:399 start_codon:yes stop_codon:yes gene_type:complete
MTITTVSYTKTYNLGSYQSEKIGIELSINEGDNAMEALDEAKKLAQEFHEKNNPEPPQSTVVSVPFEEIAAIQPLKEDKRTVKEKQEASMVALIKACKHLDGADGLKTYEKLAKSNPKFQSAYDETLLKLQN